MSAGECVNQKSTPVNRAINPMPGEQAGRRYVDTSNPYAHGALYSLFPPVRRSMMSYRVTFKLKY